MLNATATIQSTYYMYSSYHAYVLNLLMQSSGLSFIYAMLFSYVYEVFNLSI